MALKEDVDKLTTRVQALETALKVAAAVAVILGLGGATIGAKLASANEKTSQLRTDLNAMAADLPKLFGPAVDTAKQDIQKFAAGQRDTLNAKAVVASYALASTQPLVSGANVRVNFDRVVTDTHEAVTGGERWRFRAPFAGVYSVDAGLQANRGTDLNVTVRSQRAGPLLRHNSNDSAVAVSGTVSLQANEEVWIEIAHSSHPTSLQSGHCAFVLIHPL